MTIQDLGSIGELIAALATLGTIVYLAVQIRQNTQAIRGSTLHSVTQTQQNELRWGSDISDVFVKAIANTELTPDEAWRMSEWMLSAMAARQNEYVQYRQGHMASEVWEASENIICMLVSIDWNRKWWTVLGHKSFSQDFVSHVDELMKRDRIVNMHEVIQELITVD